ncbi:Vesicle transport through interaction with t-SNAREs like protein 1A [Pteropus alecto]|uniref:Vesicle transport through interaction with t-SNAREs like protein 1A n=1 Tax=Pteropus alecto TaxID=9402 RepID=L5K2I4_PTEAL|nr:Vesicle transport through interaction with t-SNAREs like protein 1A [Pteropus alecto]
MVDLAYTLCLEGTTLRETDANLGKSSRVLTGMLRRIIQNRILVVILAIILVITILMAITFSVRRH